MKLALALLTCTFLSQAQTPAVSQAQTPAVTLQSLHDRQRVLLVFGNGDNQLAEEQLTVAATHADGFRERDLLLVGLSGSNAATPTAMLSAPDDAAARQRFTSSRAGSQSFC